MDKIKILIVEDESIIALNLKETLFELDYEVCAIVPNKCRTMKVLKQGLVPDLILMDIYLKGPTTGIQLAKELKHILPNIPIIFLTANSELATIKEASETLAYGYLLKPYKKSVLHASIEMALKKAKDDRYINEELNATQAINKTLEHKLFLNKKQEKSYIKLKYGYLFDKETSSLYYGNELIKLTSKEVEIIKILCKTPGYTISQEQLEYATWKDEPAGYAAFRSLLFRLRNKIHKDLIVNYNNTGYKIEPL